LPVISLAITALFPFYHVVPFYCREKSDIFAFYILGKAQEDYQQFRNAKNTIFRHYILINEGIPGIDE
jgi:hypothetical protein